MGAVRLLAASEIRRRWRSTIAIALLVGIVGAVVFATAAGARRSATALDRFNAEVRTSSLEVNIGVGSDAKVAQFARTPGIKALAHLRAYAFDFAGAKELTVPDALAIAAPLDHAMGDQVDRSRIVAGRRARPSATEEIIVGESLADLLRIDVGTRLELPTYSPEQVERGFNGGAPEDPLGPTIPFRVVGIDRRPLDLGVRSTAGGVVILSPEFAAKWGDRIGAYTDVLRVKTSDDPADRARVSAAARRLFGEDFTFSFTNLGIETEGARNAIDVLTTTLWIVAGVAALAGLVAIGIVVARDFGHTDLDQATLRGLGFTRTQRIAIALPRMLVVAASGAFVAVVGAVALSPLFPVGVARRADPDPGVHAAWIVLGIGVLVVVSVVLGFASLATIRSTRSVVQRTRAGHRSTSAIVERAAGAGLRPTATSGLRMAIQSGHGDERVPVRSAFVGAVFGVAGVTASLVFAASLGHLIETPRLFGWTWDSKIEVGVAPGKMPCGDRHDFGIAGRSSVDAVARVCTTEIEVDGHPVTNWGFQSLQGTIDPEIVSGRAPRGPNEVALGALTLETLHKKIGDAVTARGNGPLHKFVIVGQVALPTIGEPQPLADGTTMTGPGWGLLYSDSENESDVLVVRAKAGQRDSVVRAVRSLGSGASGQARNFGVPVLPVEITRLQQVDRVPAAVAALLGGLALLAVAYALVTAVRRRRHEIAVLKILGFDRGQVQATIAWQATILAAVGLVLGIPIGIMIGRLAWNLVADGLGVSAEVATPALWLIISVPVALVLVNLIAFFPGRSAARTRPAVALREE
jgi:hypothetical protein